MSYFSIVTNIGKSKIANALQSGTAVNIAKLYVSETELIPDVGMTEPIDKIWEGNLQKYSVEGNIISASSVIPADIGTFTVRSMGLIDSEGDLFAIANVPATLKSKESNIHSVLELTISIKLDNTNAVHFDIISDFDDALDESSANAVQNKVVTKEINKLTEEINSIGLVYDPEYHSIELGDGGHSSGGGGGSGYTLTAATRDKLGGIKVGSGLSAEQDGTTTVNSIPLSEMLRLIDKNTVDTADEAENINNDTNEDIDSIVEAVRDEPIKKAVVVDTNTTEKKQENSSAEAKQLPTKINNAERLPAKATSAAFVTMAIKPPTEIGDTMIYAKDNNGVYHPVEDYSMAALTEDEMTRLMEGLEE